MKSGLPFRIPLQETVQKNLSSHWMRIVQGIFDGAEGFLDFLPDRQH